MLALPVDDTQQVLNTIQQHGPMLIIVCGLPDNIREFLLVRLQEPLIHMQIGNRAL